MMTFILACLVLGVGEVGVAFYTARIESRRGRRIEALEIEIRDLRRGLQRELQYTLPRNQRGGLHVKGKCWHCNTPIDEFETFCSPRCWERFVTGPEAAIGRYIERLDETRAEPKK